MPDKKDNPNFLLGQIAERTKCIPAMRDDISDIKGKVDSLPCDAHEHRMERVENSVDEIRLEAAGDRPKIGLLWQILLWALAAGVALAVGVVWGGQL